MYTLLKTIELYKLQLLSIENPTINEESILSLLRSRGAIVLTITAVSISMEELLGKRIPNVFHLQFKRNITIDEGIELWKPILSICLSFSNHLKNGLSDGIKNIDKIKETLNGFKQYISAVKQPNESTLKLFAEQVVI